jgi:beta-galactosidase
MKDDYNALLPMRQPGPLADVAGVEVEDYYALRDSAPVSGAWFTGSAQIWAERLRVKDAANTQIIARYGPSNGWLDGCPAVTVHAYEKGRVTFVGAYLDDASQRLLMERVVADAGVQPILKTPDGVEARCRITPSGQKVFIVINHERRDQSALLPWAAREHLSGSEVKGELMLEPYGVAVLTRLA